MTTLVLRPWQSLRQRLEKIVAPARALPNARILSAPVVTGVNRSWPGQWEVLRYL